MKKLILSIIAITLISCNEKEDIKTNQDLEKTENEYKENYSDKFIGTWKLYNIEDSTIFKNGIKISFNEDKTINVLDEYTGNHLALSKNSSSDTVYFNHNSMVVTDYTMFITLKDGLINYSCKASHCNTLHYFKID